MTQTNMAGETPNTSERRRFLQGAARAAAGIAGLTALAAVGAHADSKPLTLRDIPTKGYLALPGLNLAGDIRVLNYALALEDFESDLYAQAVMRLTGGGTNRQGKSIPGLGLGRNEMDVYFIQKFAAVEAAHREYLRGALKLDGIIRGIPISRKLYEFGMESKSREEVLALVRQVEATGTAAYLGAIPYFKTKLFLTAAAGIQGTEARHTTTLTIVENMLFKSDSPSPVAPLAGDNHGIDTPMDPDAVLAQVSPYIMSA